MEKSVSLVLKNLSVGYKSSVLNGINREINSPKLIGIIGRNGSGKSTLTKTLLKIIPPINGEILLNNKNINDFSVKEWATYFSAVFSGVPNVPHILVNEMIDLGCNKNNPQKPEIINWLKIENLINKYADELSDGQLQKVMIARALNQNTPYIILDEPTNHLDYIAKDEIFDLIKKIVQNRQKTVFLISHEIDKVKNVADEIWLVENGKIINLSP